VELKTCCKTESRNVAHRQRPICKTIERPLTFIRKSVRFQDMLSRRTSGKKILSRFIHSIACEKHQNWPSKRVRYFRLRNRNCSARMSEIFGSKLEGDHQALCYRRPDMSGSRVLKASLSAGVRSQRICLRCSHTIRRFATATIDASQEKSLEPPILLKMRSDMKDAMRSKDSNRSVSRHSMVSMIHPSLYTQ